MILRPEQDGQRLDVYLAEAVEGLSRSAAQKLIASGALTLDGQSVRKMDKTIAGREYALEIPEAKPVAIEAQDIALDVVWEDADCLVINKPKGLVVHPAAGHWDGTLVNALLHHCGAELSGINGEIRPGIVHRIDKDTSGLLIVAKNDFAHQALAAQLQDHTLSRVYECIVVGGMKADSGTIDAPIGRHPRDRKRMAVVPGGREAVTDFEVVARYRGYTHLRLRLHTGRTHQIRVHLAWKGHPILGDPVYGRKTPELGQDTQCLHAKELTFLHPRTGEPITVTCPLPAYFQDVLSRLSPL